MASLVAFGYTDPGRQRDQNEDAFDLMPAADNPRAGLYVVADGMGGHAAGEVASAIAIDRITAVYRGLREGTLAERLERAVQDANLAIYRAGQEASRQGMGSTVVCAAFEGEHVVSAHVGDSRLYRLRGAAIERLTRDHSLVQARVDSGLMTLEEAEAAGNRNIITRALGLEPDVKVELGEHPVLPGDRYLLCTDGLAGTVSDREIQHIASGQQPEVACQQLVELANERGGPDNITAVVIAVTPEDGDVDSGESPEPTTQEIPRQSLDAVDDARRAEGTVGDALRLAEDAPPLGGTIAFARLSPAPVPPSPAAPSRRRRPVAGVLTLVALALVLVIGLPVYRSSTEQRAAPVGPAPAQGGVLPLLQAPSPLPALLIATATPAATFSTAEPTPGAAVAATPVPTPEATATP